MLFNSYVFIFGFLPLALIGYQIAAQLRGKVVIAWLGLISVAFYAWWRPAFVILLLGSITANYLAAVLISRNLDSPGRSRLWMAAAIVVNLLVLGYFKYLFPVLNFWSSALGAHAHWADVVLPLGISFFTFTQIAYLVDLKQGTAKLQDPMSYLLFVTFFPHLIAGPILHHQEMMPQFQDPRRRGLNWNDVAVGFSWFIMGLAKKVLVADHFAPTVNAIYALHEPLPALLAWRAVLGYALQLYFDFSGYSDMALGLARMFSIDFPLNFSSPYKATSVIDFWQRWHITLTRYITAYVYSPVQLWVSRRRQAQGKKVSRKALATPEGFISMTAAPMLFTMGIAGIWHGAGLQYVVFGLLHGFYLTVNHGWRTFRHARTPTPGGRPVAAPLEQGGGARMTSHITKVALTFFCVLIAQVYFRAESCGQAASVLAGMFGFHGAGLRTGLPGESLATVAHQGAVMIAAFGIVWLLPNTQQILARFKPALETTVWDTGAPTARLLWYPNVRWALLLSVAFISALVGLKDPSTFLYFQF
jgi:D-alanyl-lipoteichoic acid acyltransferase DltB (MBOAT superfamily)